jgi:small ligand-binding sensory domain FIST
MVMSDARAAFASSMSEHPDSSVAVGEIIGELLETLPGTPDLCVLFSSAHHRPRLEAVTHTIAELLGPRICVGSTAAAVLGGSREVETGPALSVWAAVLPEARLEPVRLWAEQTSDGWQVLGLPDSAGEARSLLLLGDPFTFPIDRFLARVNAELPHLAVIGGMASASDLPAGNVLIGHDSIGGPVGHWADGAVGVLLDSVLSPAEVSPRTVVSQGCRPIGAPFTVTASDGPVIGELGGRPALERLIEVITDLDETDRSLAAHGLHCGIVIEDSKLDYERGDFLIRAVLGADRERGGVAVGEAVPVGATVQFHVRDAATADEDLTILLTRAGASEPARAALVFTCNGRGAHLFGHPHHDASAVQEVLGPSIPLAGMFCAGEIGPLNGRNHLHGFTASVAVFR